ncbi:two-component regulator propeller domain-containing protein [Emticicia sp. BO119]|uniref:ligand-binding sensor domain-containing protein n=1 Tax=Emticicia sp. BO119 TaxID=2757768 RepID=UPI0015F10946|nr:two-component regulator propeller domain-containing protein [Emticicia sp. BO119]MBA4851442.1 histidine kinase [Emticicia sp. BO119]
MKHLYFYVLLLFTSCTVCNAQNQQRSYYPIEPETKEVVTSHGPLSITRNIKQDKKGNIWIAAFDGIFRYDPSGLLKIGGKAFTNITSEVSKARFFDVLEDRKGNFWFSSIGSGVFYYNPSKTHKDAFQHFTTKEGLANDRVPHIYEDKSGNVWFGTEGGASLWDGKSFRTFKPNAGLTNADPNDNDINSIVEDKTGKFWIATRGNLFTYDGKKFTIFTHNGDPFINVRTIMEDKKGNIWLAGAPGLWRVNGSTFTNFTLNFTGYVYEDRKSNIWTSSKPEYSYNGGDRWALSRYDAKTLLSPKPTATDIMQGYEDYKNMLFGILEANDGSIWFGSLGGVYRYDPAAPLRAGERVITAFKDK